MQLAADAGLYEPLRAQRLWQDGVVQANAWNAVWEVLQGRMQFVSENRQMLSASLEAAKAWARQLSKGTRLREAARMLRPEGRTSPAPVMQLVDRLAWGGVIGAEFDEIWRSRCMADEADDWSGEAGMAAIPDVQASILAGAAYSLVVQARLDSDQPLLVPHWEGAVMANIVRHCAVKRQGDHLLLSIDVGRLLPDPAPGVDTAALISFRNRYDDERQRLVNAVERLVEQYSTCYEHPGDIGRSVQRDVNEALKDMTAAGGKVLRG